MSTAAPLPFECPAAFAWEWLDSDREDRRVSGYAKSVMRTAFKLLQNKTESNKLPT